MRILLASALVFGAFFAAGCDFALHPIRCTSGVTCSDHGSCEIRDGAEVCFCDSGYVPVSNSDGPDCVPANGQDGGGLDGGGQDGGPLDGGGQDGGPLDGGGQDSGPLDGGSLCDNADCSGPGLPGQGFDQDGDTWGECCDCDDDDPHVYPLRSELIYNCIDDDCDDLTPDDDLDNDGYGSMARICDPGLDCDDREPLIHPGAVEECDGVDNNCDGATDGGACAECPDVSGLYRIEAFCMMIENVETVVTQAACGIALNLEGIPCAGTLDAGLNAYLECAGIPVACTGVWSIVGTFQITCSPECYFQFTPQSDNPVCDFHDDPVCTDHGRLCGVTGNAGQPETRCVNTIPDGRGPGYFCDPAGSIDCINSLCLDGYCGAICQTDATCSPFSGTSCQSVAYDDGQGTAGDISSCAPVVPGETICGRTPDCSPVRVCSYRATDDDVRTVCRLPVAGAGAPGELCTQNADCQNNLCMCGNELCAGEQGRCSAICRTGSDCLQGYECSLVPILDLQGSPHMTPACIQDQDSCGHDDVCPAGKCCQLFVGATGDYLESLCYWGAGTGEPSTGESCDSSIDCCSGTCFDHPGFCLGLCYVDGDCPTFDGGACTTDLDCELGFVCQGSACTRSFSCRTQPFALGGGIVDTANICIPDRRTCALPSDCRPGEACRQYYNASATDVAMQCDVGGPGAGRLGDDCSTGGASDCWNGLCLLNGDPGRYCSQACITDNDCGDPAAYYCGSVLQEIRPGFDGYLSVCIKRNP